MFADADWFHFTGITPALGGEMPEACLEAVKAAKAKGLTVSCDLNYRGKLDQKGYMNVAEQLKERFGFKFVAITLRGSISASENNWAGMLYDGEKAYLSKNYLIHIVDRVGGGDSFGGALIHAMRKGFDGQSAIEFAVAASCLKQTIEFDFNHATEKEAFALVGGNSSGRVQR